MSGYTQLPNIIIDALPDMGKAETKLTIALCRVTYGYHRETARLTYDDLEQMTGLSRQGIADGMLEVEKRGFFKKTGKRSEWQTVKLSDQSSNQTKKQSSNQTETVKLSDQNSLPTRPHYKERINKDKKRERAPDGDAPPPDKDHPAIVAWRMANNRYPSKKLYGFVAESLGHTPDEQALRRVCTLWDAKGYRPTNIAGKIEWYRQAINYDGDLNEWQPAYTRTGQPQKQIARGYKPV